MSKPKTLPELATEFADAKESDVFLYSAPVNRSFAQIFCNSICGIKHRRKSATLFLTTSGGDPDAAFLIGRSLQRHYQKGGITVYIFGSCKSAGTLICVGANHIVMSDSGELGPLDIQLGKDDELFKRSSGLDLTEATKYLKDLSWELFRKYFVDLKRGTSITTKTAAEIAQGLAVGIVAPIASQIDPLRLGEVQRAMRITKDYGTLLNPTLDVDRLIAAFPSHGFVIDREQAKLLFQSVRPPDEKEIEFSRHIWNFIADESDFAQLISQSAELKKHEQAPIQPVANGEHPTEPAAAPIRQ